MPRSKSGCKKPRADAVNVQEAVNAVLASPSKKLGMREAARQFNVKSSTLQRHVAKFKASHQQTFLYVNNCGHRQVFSDEEDKQLVSYIKVRAKLHYVLSLLDIRKLAFDFAKAKGKSYPNSWEEAKCAGVHWLKLFMKKYSADVSLRIPEGTSLSRCTSFNSHNANLFFDHLEKCHSRYGPFFPPERILNVDESGLSTVQTPPKIVAAKGEKQVGSVTSGERRQNTTLISGINAVGNHIPPLFVFPRAKYRDHMLNGAPAGSIGATCPSGWSNEVIFLYYLDHFIKFAQPTADKPILLTLDNHYSHCTIEAIDKATANHITLFIFPPHTSHKFQALDRTVFGPLKAYYKRGITEWMIKNPGRPFDIFSIAFVVGKIHNDAFSARNITSGFRCSGIFPYDRNVFSADEHLSSYVTNRPLPNNASQPLQNEPQGNAPQLDKNVMIHQPHGSHEPEDIPTPILTEQAPVVSSSTMALSPEDVCPLPKAAPRKQSQPHGRKPGKTRILTDTPERHEVAVEKEESQETACCQQEWTRCKKSKAVRQIIFQEQPAKDDSSDEDQDIDYGDNVDEADTGNESSDEEVFQSLNKYEEGDFVMVKFSKKSSIRQFILEKSEVKKMKTTNTPLNI